LATVYGKQPEDFVKRLKDNANAREEKESKEKESDEERKDREDREREARKRA
jgi:hypothetical protein